MTDSSITQLQPYDFVFRSTADGIIIADSDMNIQQANPAAVSMLGITLEGLIGVPVQECLHQNAALLNLFTREGDQALDVRLPRRRLAVGIATTLETGERVVLLQDVTEKRMLEARRESLTKAIAHDLRNPLTAIAGFADLITKFGELSPQQEKFATRIRQTSVKLHEVVGTLVELAWIEAGMPMAHVPIDLSEIIDRAVTDMAPLAKRSQIAMAISVQAPLPAVMGDPERLYLVIYHLLHNAVLYSLPERTIAVHAWSDDHEIYCSVADRGFGISDGELDRIFDRMYRSSDERVRNIAGGGLGLTLARTIVTRLGGDIWAASNEGEGSVFTFVLPCVEL